MALTLPCMSPCRSLISPGAAPPGEPELRRPRLRPGVHVECARGGAHSAAGARAAGLSEVPSPAPALHPHLAGTSSYTGNGSIEYGAPLSATC